MLRILFILVSVLISCKKAKTTTEPQKPIINHEELKFKMIYTKGVSLGKDIVEVGGKYVIYGQIGFAQQSYIAIYNEGDTIVRDTVIYFNGINHIGSIVEVGGMYVISGVTNEMGDMDLYLVMLNESLRVIRKKIYYYPGNQFLEASIVIDNTLIPSNEGGVVWAGSEQVNKPDIVIMKFDKELNEEWRVVYGFENSAESVHEVVAVADGYVLFGAASVYNSDSGFAYALKISENGNVVWARIYEEFLGAFSVVKLSDGFFVSAITRDKKLSFAKLDFEGNVLWKKYYAGDLPAGFRESVLMDDGSIIGIIIGFAPNVYFYKVDSEGNLIWERRYYIPGISGARTIYKTSDGNVVGVGGSYWNDTLNGVIFFKINSADGSVMWDYEFIRGRY